MIFIIFAYYLHISYIIYIYIYVYYVCVHVFFYNTCIHIVPETYQRRLWVRVGLAGWNSQGVQEMTSSISGFDIWDYLGMIFLHFSGMNIHWPAICGVSRIKLGHPNVSSPPQHEWTASSKTKYIGSLGLSYLWYVFSLPKFQHLLKLSWLYQVVSSCVVRVKYPLVN